MNPLLRLLPLLLLLVCGSSAAWSVDHGRILDPHGRPVQLRGVSWFGFENDSHMVNGLWARNWREMAGQMKVAGFNAVRIPLCPHSLRGVAPGAIDYHRNPELRDLNSLEVLDRVVQLFEELGMMVLLDHHRPNCYAISELWYTDSYSEAQWLQDLVLIAERYRGRRNVIGLELKNEPHGVATWGAGEPHTDWNKAAERAAKAVLAAAPDWLMFVQGIEKPSHCTPHWTSWGENLEPLRCTALDIPANRLVLAPHSYGPDVFVKEVFKQPNFPANMPALWETHYGQFVQAGYTVVPTEFGGKYGEGHPQDKLWQDAYVDWLIAKGIHSGFYWSWNPNSADTGGILRDDWQSLRQDKLDLLERWWSGTETAASNGTPVALAPVSVSPPAASKSSGGGAFPAVLVAGLLALGGLAQCSRQGWRAR